MSYNRYIGSREYVIAFRRGTHVVIEVLPDGSPEHPVVFSGHYDACVEWLEKRECEYEESAF